MFCPKCGEKNKEGANFCVKCGESFDSKTSKSKTTKTTKTAKITTDDVKELTKEVTKEMTNDASTIIKDMISKPIDSLKKYGEEKRFNLALCLTGIMSLLVGLFSIAFIKNLYASIMELVRSYMGSLMYYSSGGAEADIPYLKVFFIVLVVTFALSFVFVGVLYFVNNVIFKGKESFKRMYVIYSIISIVVSASLLTSLILSFISIKLATIVLSLGLTLSSFYVYHMIKLVGPKDENKHGYIYVLTSGIFYLAVYIIISLFI